MRRFQSEHSMLQSSGRALAAKQRTRRGLQRESRVGGDVDPRNSPGSYSLSNPVRFARPLQRGGREGEGDVARLEKERLAETETAQQALKNPEFGQMFSALRGQAIRVSAVCLVTSAAP